MTTSRNDNDGRAGETPDERIVRENIREHDWLTTRGRLPMWTVYNPTASDHPGRWSARLWASLPRPQATDRLIVRNTLDEVRALLPPGLACITRSPAETWL